MYFLHILLMIAPVDSRHPSLNLFTADFGWFNQSEPVFSSRRMTQVIATWLAEIANTTLWMVNTLFLTL